MPPNWQILQQPSVEYLKAQLAANDVDRTKRALQELCRLYRRGFRIDGNERRAVEINIIGLLHSSQGKDEKVRRWALNALAQLGRESECIEAIIGALDRHQDDPQTAASAVAAIYSLCRDPATTMRRITFFDPQLATLAALQHADKKLLDLKEHLPLKLDTAGPESLKLALVVVGLDRAPPHLFHPRHDNAAIVKVLGGHHHNVVSQYSIWAITENSSLGLADLGVPLHTIEQQPPNVRSWMFQVVGMSPSLTPELMEYIELGASYPEESARLGLAIGLRENYFDGVEPIILDWTFDEDSAEVRQTLVDHVVKHSARFGKYHSVAVQIYEAEAPRSSGRLRMASNAVGTPLHLEFRRIDFGVSTDLFSRAGVTIVNKTKISGGVQGGAVNIGSGQASNEGIVSNHYAPQTIDAIRSHISSTMETVRQSQLADSDDCGQRFRSKPVADSDPRRTGIPMIPSRVVVDVAYGVS